MVVAMSADSSTSEPAFVLARPAEICPAEITQLNVVGEKFVTMTSTLTEGSTYFAKLLSLQWISSATLVDSGIFVDADPHLFRHILNYLRRSLLPVFGTRANGFDHPLYAALREEARYLGIESLEQWIAEERYMASITITESIETVDLNDCLSKGSTCYSDHKRKQFHPSDYETKGGLKRKRIDVQHWNFTARVNDSWPTLLGTLLITLSRIICRLWKREESSVSGTRRQTSTRCESVWV
jgi:hypothetical protein